MRMRRSRITHLDICARCTLDNDGVSEKLEPHSGWVAPEVEFEPLDPAKFFTPAELKKLEEWDAEERRLMSLTPEEVEREYHRRKRDPSASEGMQVAEVTCQHCGAEKREDLEFFYDPELGVICQKCYAAKRERGE